MNRKSGTGIGKILEEMVEDFQDDKSETSLSYSFLSNYKSK